MTSEYGERVICMGKILIEQMTGREFREGDCAEGNIPPVAHLLVAYRRGNESAVPEIPVSREVNADQTGIVAR
ncbi:MAG: hypothetical protein VB144_01260 [Clostridia bacterium]|nr:hypothetical protein [Clostridia bacterium]